MKTIKVFIASSEELKMERLEFTDMIQQLNRIFKPRGLEIELVKWEYLDASMGPLHKQEEYNNELKTCEMCLVLYWTRFGDYTKSELETAYSELCAGRNPQKLYVYFKDAEYITPELKAFKDSFDTSYGHFYCRFENVDTMKLNFLLQFEAYQNMTSESMLKVQDSRIEVDGKPLVELKNIPFAGNNPEYLQLLRRIEVTQARVLKYPDEIEFRQELDDLQKKQKIIENSLLDTAKLITKLSSTVSSARFLEAIRLFEAGDNKGANTVLNLDNITHDAEGNAVRIDAAREIASASIKALESNIEELQLKIQTIQNSMEEGWVNEVISVYDKAVTLARNRISLDKFFKLIFEYALFLQRNKQFSLVDSLYNETLSVCRLLAVQNPEKYDSNVALTLTNLGALHYDTQQFDAAEKEYIEALKIRRCLLEKNPGVYESDVADTLNNLANLHMKTQCFDIAEKEFIEALEIRRRLAKESPDLYEIKVAKILNNLALLYTNIERFNDAEKVFMEALGTFRYLSEKNPDAYTSYIAGTLNNLANLHVNTKHFAIAEKEYMEAMAIYRCLSKKQPEVYASNVAMTLNSLANLHATTQRFNIAEKEYIEALNILRHLFELNPKVYENYVADTLYALATLHYLTQHFDIAEKEFIEVLERFRCLCEKDPTIYKKSVGLTMYNLANLHRNTQHFDIAEQEYLDALKIFRHMTEKNHKVYESYISGILNSLANLHTNTQHFDIAEEEYIEALKIRRRLSAQNPDAYEGDLAMTLVNYAILFIKTQHYELAIQKLKEGLKIYQHMASYTYVDTTKVHEIESLIEMLQTKYEKE